MIIHSAIPLPTIKRMPGYYFRVNKAIQAGEEFISTSQLAEHMHLKAIQVRKDIEYTGVKGRTKLGYPTKELERVIGSIIGLESNQDCVLIGAGSLGRAFLAHEGFEQYGIRFVAAFDIKKTEDRIAKTPLYLMDSLEKHVKRKNIKTAVLTVSREASIEAATACVEAGIKAIWNFTGARFHQDEYFQNTFVKNIDLGFLFSSFLAEFHHLPNMEGGT